MAQAGLAARPTQQQLPRVSLARWQEIASQAREEPAPVIVEGAYADSVAALTWSPTMFAERFGDAVVNVAVDLPEHDAPYLGDHTNHETRLRLADLVTRIEAGERCYLNQASLATFGDLAADLDLGVLAVPPIYGVNLWIGGRTRSGLHYDSADNFLIQVFGAKRATLVAPRHARALRPVRDNPSKSSLGSDEIEDMPHGWSGILEPGDAAYIPRGWWHYLAADTASISVNVWHGDQFDVKAHLAVFARSGAAVWLRTVRDLLWSGLLGRPHQQRLFSPPPLGVVLYRRLRRSGG